MRITLLDAVTRSMFLRLKAFFSNGTLQQSVGARSERAAEAYLVRNKKFKVLSRNYRAGHDEIDLVCRDAEVLVFVEVRARSERALVSGFHSIGRRKKTALRRVCTAYLKGLPKRPMHYRFDVVELRLPSDSKSPTINHYKNVPLFSLT